MGRWRQWLHALRLCQLACDARDFGRAALRVRRYVTRNIFRPEHREVWRRHFSGSRKIQPDLEQLERVCLISPQQRKHLGVHDTAPGRQPLHIAVAEARRGAERICVVDEAFAHDRHRLKPAVRMRWKAGNGPAVIHAPAVLAGEILSDVAPGERRVWARVARCRADKRRRDERTTGRDRSCPT